MDTCQIRFFNSLLVHFQTNSIPIVIRNFSRFIQYSFNNLINKIETESREPWRKVKSKYPRDIRLFHENDRSDEKNQLTCAFFILFSIATPWINGENESHSQTGGDRFVEKFVHFSWIGEGVYNDSCSFPYLSTLSTNKDFWIFNVAAPFQAVCLHGRTQILLCHGLLYVECIVQICAHDTSVRSSLRKINFIFHVIRVSSGYLKICMKIHWKDEQMKQQGQNRI